MSNQKKKRPVTVFIQLIIVLIILPFSPILLTRHWTWWQAWVYGGISLFGFFISRGLAVKKHPDIIKERSESFSKKDSKSWDKILSPLMAFSRLFISLTAGFDVLFNLSPDFSFQVHSAGIILILFGYILASYALVENRFFSGIVRIQSDRGHTVVSTGPYKWIRHPGYSGMLITNAGIPLLLDSYWAFIPVFLLSVVAVVRTHLEDKTLQAELDGYSEYTKKTKKRLIPFIW
jgi:protein-S-isoprenylcysteine O-methyltransferase Ste14